jgi:hypothetical protein
MQYGNQLASTYSQLKIHIVIVETESKEKLEELNKKIEEDKSSILHNNNVSEVEGKIPTIPSDLNEEWETVKENASREIPTIPPDLNAKWETVKANANKVPGIESSIPTIPSDLNTKWETVKANANKVLEVESKLVKLEAASFCQSIIENTITNCPWINLQAKITAGEKYFSPIKTSAGNDIYPKTTHTLLTVY